MEAFLQQRRARGTILYASITGSHSFNLNVETSDEDYFAVFAAAPEVLFSTAPPVEAVSVLRLDGLCANCCCAARSWTVMHNLRTCWCTRWATIASCC